MTGLATHHLLDRMNLGMLVIVPTIGTFCSLIQFSSEKLLSD